MKGTNPSLVFRTFYKLGFVNGLKTIYQLNRGKENRVQLPTTRFPFYLRSNTSDVQLFHSIFLMGEYDFNLPDEPRTIIDAGANVGLFAIKMKNRYPKARIICIEPDPENFELLKRNVEPYKDILCENKGIWSRNTRLKINDKYNLGKWGMCVEEDETGNIDATTIESLLRKYSWSGVDLLKMDIEGSEKQVFSQGEAEWLLNVRTLAIELHDRFEPGCAQPFFQAINKYLKTYEYEVRAENTIVTNKTFR